MRTTKAFTLIELLVVIAIIMILASIALPVINSAVISAQKADCLGRLRQIGLAMQEYAGQHKQRYPPHRSNDHGPHWNDAATFALYPSYIDNRETFYCPISYPRYNPDTYWDKPGGEVWDYVWGYQYMGNYHVAGQVFYPDVATVVPKRMGQETGNKDLAILQDNVWHSVSGGHYNGAHPCRSYDPRAPIDVNVYFYDGRAERRLFSSLSLRCANGQSYYYWP